MIWCSDARQNVSTHSRLKAAGADAPDGCLFMNVSTHSRLKAAGQNSMISTPLILFQHTAA